MVRLLTVDATAEAIEADVDPGDAAQVNAALAAITAFQESPTSLIWYELVEKYVWPKTTTVTQLAVQLQNARPERWDAEDFKDQVWQACLDNDTAFLRSLSEAAYLVAKGEHPPLDTTGAALEAYREEWLMLRRNSSEPEDPCPDPDDVKERVKQKLGRTISRSQWLQTLRKLRALFAS